MNSWQCVVKLLHVQVIGYCRCHFSFQSCDLCCPSIHPHTHLLIHLLQHLATNLFHSFHLYTRSRTHPFMHLPPSLCIQSSLHFLFPIIPFNTTALTSSTSLIPCTSPTLQFYSSHMSCQHIVPPMHPATQRHKD